MPTAPEGNRRTKNDVTRDEEIKRLAAIDVTEYEDHRKKGCLLSKAR
jgi:hypothetical protein